MSLPEVVLDPAVMAGKPVIAGTRITVELILERLAAGHTYEDVERSFPHLPAGSIRAALRYAGAGPSGGVV
jgi:uncharacterized protein (DUF433 family)